MLYTSIIIQLLDGILTYIGLNIGYKEGNPILLYFMEYNIELTLVGAKLLAIIFLYCLYKLNYIKAIIFLNIYYIILAVIPWLIFIFLG